MAKPQGEVIANCPKCGVGIGNEHIYMWCQECGNQLPPEITTLIPGLTGQLKQPQSIDTYRAQAR